MVDDCTRRDDAAAWVLGALPDEEAGGFREHLAGCAACRSEVAKLQPTVDTLLLAAPQVAPPPALRDRIMRTVNAEAELLAAAGPELDRPPARAPRRRRWSLGLPAPFAAALACAVLALGVTAGVLLPGEDGAAARTVPAQVALPDAFRTSAQLVVQDDGDASLVVAGMPGPPEGRVYQVWVLHEGEQAPRPTDALFQPSEDGRATVQVPGGTEGVAAVMVTDEPDGGSRTPTRDPSIVAKLA